MNKRLDKQLVSVIMPVKNGERFLRESVGSILKQDYSLVEVIIVDGQSTDGTGQIAKSFKKVRYIYQDENPGIPQAKNLGIKIAKGEFIAFASHDDIWAPNKLSTQIDYMNNYQVQYTITRVKYFLEPGSLLKPGFNEKLLKDNYIGKMPETLVARKSLFDSIGCFSTEFNYMEDIDWFNRADMNNIPMAVIDDVLLFKRVHDTNVSYDSSKISRINKEIMSLLKESVDRKRVYKKNN